MHICDKWQFIVVLYHIRSLPLVQSSYDREVQGPILHKDLVRMILSKLEDNDMNGILDGSDLKSLACRMSLRSIREKAKKVGISLSFFLVLLLMHRAIQITDCLKNVSWSQSI